MAVKTAAAGRLFSGRKLSSRADSAIHRGEVGAGRCAAASFAPAIPSCAAGRTIPVLATRQEQL